ncbi:MAG: DUF4159 domain-containing protein [Bacteroidales bacterium]|nr:DUF4159 domain-containing protein [Bacteroidales bacterium]
MRKHFFIFFFCLFILGQLGAQGVQIALLKYSGGGDWYANPTSLPNLVKFCNQSLKTNLSNEIATVEAGSVDLFNYPFIHMTGHGNVIFSPDEAENLRNYLIAGGFLHISDNYGLDEYIRREMRKVFPGTDFVELPFDHPIYHQHFQFPDGLPKIHKHDDKPPQGFGIVYQGRLVCFYDYECDLGDGWEDPEVHNDSPEKRREALQMGANIIQFAFEQ